MGVKEDIVKTILELKNRREFKSQKEIAEHLGYNISYFSRALNSTPIPYEFERRFFKNFPKNSYQASSEFHNSLKEPQSVYQNEAEQVKFNLMEVPLVPIFAQAGFLNGYGDTVYMDELPKEHWEVDREYKGHYLVFEVKGDSMDNNSNHSLIEGDKILCREIGKEHWSNKLHINKWNFVIAHRERGIVVKRIIEHNVESGIIKCHSLNEYYEDFEVNLSDVIALYNVVDLKRKNLRL